MAKNRYGTKKGKKTRGKARGKRKSPAKKRVARKTSGKRDARGQAIHYCSRGSCSRRPIFGGAKGLATHTRRKHRG